MTPNLYIENGCFTKHQFINGCLGFQVYIDLYIYIDVLDKKLVLAIIVKLQGSIISSYLLLGFQRDSCDRLIHKHSFTTAKWPCVEPISGNSMKQLSDLPDWGPQDSQIPDAEAWASMGWVWIPGSKYSWIFIFHHLMGHDDSKVSELHFG